MKYTLKSRSCAIVLLVLLNITNAFSEKWKMEQKQVTLQLIWKHQFQFAGYYAAIEKGYYKKAGITVDLKEPSEGISPSQVVINGKAEFGICSSDILLMREKHQRAVVLATIFQHSPLILIASKKSGIDHIHDLVGKKIDIEPNAADLIAYMQDEGVLLSKCLVAPHKFDVSGLIDGTIDATSAYSTDEPFVLNQAKFDYTLLNPRMNGIDFYGDVLFTTEDLIRRDPILVENFRKASIKGWKYAMAHPEEIAQLIYKKYSKRHSIQHLRFEAQEMRKLIMEDVVEIGYTNPNRWESIADTYKKMKMLDTAFTIEGLLYSDYIHPKDNIPWNLIILFLIVTFAISSIAYALYRYSKRLKVEINNRHKIEKELSDSEEHYRMLFEDNPSAMVVIETNTKISMVNKSYSLMTGYSPEEVVGLSWTRNIHPDDLPRLMEYNKQRQINPSNTPNRYEFMFYHKDGTLKHGLMSVMMLDYSQKIIASFIDITNRKLAEEKLQESETKLKTIIETSPDGIAISSLEGSILFATRQALSMWGYDSEAEMIGKNVMEFTHPSYHEKAIYLISEMHNGNLTGAAEYLMIRKNGSQFYAEANANILKDAQGLPIGILYVLREITERKQNEEKLRQSEVLLHNFEKDKEVYELKSRFVATASHEFRTPLATILLTNDSLLNYWNRLEKPQIEAKLEKIKTNVLHLTSIVNDVLQISRIQEGKMEFNPIEIDFITFCKEIMAEFQEDPNHNSIIFDCDIVSARILIDERLIRQAINNLISNGLKYSIENKPIQVSIKMSSNEINFSVQDHGIGIPIEDQKHLFAPFFRATNSKIIPGNGLGLNISQEYAKMHDGEITFTSVENEGSIFVLHLPIDKI